MGSYCDRNPRFLIMQDGIQRLDHLFHIVDDDPDCVINFDVTHKTISVREQDTTKQMCCPIQIRYLSCKGTIYLSIYLSIYCPYNMIRS